MTLGFIELGSWGWSWQVWCPPVRWAVSPALFLQRPGLRADRLAQPRLCAAAAQPWLPPSGPLACLGHLPLGWWDCPVEFLLPGWFPTFLPSQ